MKKEAQDHPCRECPFRWQSPPGWLGPWETPEELLQVAFSEDGFACHMTVRQEGSWAGARVCAGSLHCASKSSKRYKDSEMARLQAEADAAPEHANGVLDAPRFIKHHNSLRRETSPDG